jgi:hypothetical protein
LAKDHDWQPGTVYDNVAAAVSVLGVRAPGVIWGIANMNWETLEDRDRFLSALRAKGI